VSHANDNRARRIEVDCWLEGGSPFLVSVFGPDARPEPIESRMFETSDEALAAAERYSQIHGPARIYDLTGDVA
jgi:hypothetical protein